MRKSQERDYRQHFKAYVLARLGPVFLSELAPRDILDVRSWMLERGLSLKTARNVIDGSLRAMLRDARLVDRQAVDRELFDGIVWPQRPKNDPDPFTEDERDIILGYYLKRNAMHHAFVYTQFHTGLRPSETTALRWGDVDLTRLTIQVSRSRNLDVEAATKTRASSRVVEMTGENATLLQQLKPLRVTESHYVFLNATGRPISQDNWRADYWYSALRACGIRERKFYATRHTYISMELTMGSNIKWLAEQCGTSMAMIENNYGKFLRPERGKPVTQAVTRRKKERNSR